MARSRPRSRGRSPARCPQSPATRRITITGRWHDKHPKPSASEERARPGASGRRGMSTAIVVGAGPNGLAAAVALAKAGLQVTVLEAADEVGGGTRTSEAIIPGLLHDHCSAIHPMAVGSQFLAG